MKGLVHVHKNAASGKVKQTVLTTSTETQGGPVP